MSIKLIPTKGMGGIDRRHTRKLGMSSNGKNFYTRNGALFTRDGNSAFDTAGFNAAMESLHSVSRIGVDTQILVQKGRKLYHNTGSWVELGSNIVPNANYVLHSTRYVNSLILVCGRGDGAEGVATLAGDAVTSIAVTNGGTRYDTAPLVDISGDGTLATATTTITDGKVTSITVTAGGSGYTTAPSVTIYPATASIGAWDYDISAGTLTALSSGDADVVTHRVPQMQYIVNWKNRLFGWAPDGTNSAYIYFCGEDDYGNPIKDMWPVDYYFNISGEAGLPILSAIPYQTHLLILTARSFYRMWGDTPDDFSVQYGGVTSVHSADTCVIVNDIVVWLGVEDGNNVIYAYTGTSPTRISQPIDELIRDKSLTNVQAYAVDNQFWLVFPNSPTNYTTVYVYDLTESEWYIYEYPFVWSTAVTHGEYNARKYLHVAISEISNVTHYYIMKIDNSDADADGLASEVPITTEFVVGPFEMEGIKFKAKSLYIQAQPTADFDINFYVRIDSNTERGPIVASFADAVNPYGDYDVIVERVRVGRVKGSVGVIRATTTDRIIDLQKIDLVINPRDVK